MTSPVVTVVLSIDEHPQHLRGCLDGLLAQTIADRLEVLVRSAGGGEVARVVRDYRADFGRLMICPPVATDDRRPGVLQALAVATGRYVTCIRPLDRHRADALELMARALDLDPDRGLVYADSLQAAGEVLGFSTTAADLLVARPDFSLPHALAGGLLGPHPIWRRGSCPTSLGAGETEHDLFLRIAVACHALHLRVPLTLVPDRRRGRAGAARGRAGTARGRESDQLAVRQLRASLELDAVFPQLHDHRGDPLATVAAWFELGTLCALGQHCDPQAALRYYQAALAVELPDRVARRVAAAAANNSACLLHFIGLEPQAQRALALAADCPEASWNRRLLASVPPDGPRMLPLELAFAEIKHPVLDSSRRTPGLALGADGDLMWGPERVSPPWHFLAGPQGLPISPAEREVFNGTGRLPAPRRAPHYLFVADRWPDAEPGTVAGVVREPGEAMDEAMDKAVDEAVVNGLRARGCRVSLFCGGARPDPEQGLFGVVRHVRQGVDVYRVIDTWPDLDCDPIAPQAFAQIVTAVAPDRVFGLGLQPGGPRLIEVCRALGLPTAWLLHDATSTPGRLEDLRVITPDSILVASERLRRECLEQGVAPDSVSVVEPRAPGLDAIWEAVGATRRVCTGRSAPLRLGVFAPTLDDAELDLLVQALQALPRGSVQATVHCSPAAAGGGEARINELQRQDQGCFAAFDRTYTGPRMAALLARCDLVVVTAEALRRAPIVASEALAARAPVLLSAAAETCGDVAPGVTGLVFESGAVAHLAGLIRSFLIDRTLLGRLQAAITAPPGFDGYLDGLLAAVRESVALERPEPALGQRLEPALGQRLEQALGQRLEQALGQRLEQALGQRPDRLPQTIGGSA